MLRALFVIAVASAREYAVEMSQNGWTERPTAPVLAAERVHFTVVLEQTNLDAVKHAALAVSTSPAARTRPSCTRS